MFDNNESNNDDISLGVVGLFASALEVSVSSLRSIKGLSSTYVLPLSFL